MKKFHWIDDSIKIDFEVPKIMQDLMNTAEKLDLEENYAYFEYADQIDVDAKNLCADGYLTESEWEKLSMRYGGW